MCLGLNQGSMSRAFNYYPLVEAGKGHWLGEEAFFFDVDNKIQQNDSENSLHSQPLSQMIGHSIKCKTNVKVLEISLTDFKDKMPAVLI